MRLRVILFSLAISLSSVSHSSILDQEHTMLTHYYPPYYDRSLSGIGYDVVKVIFNKAGLKVKFKEVPWPRLLLMAKSNQYAFTTVGGAESDMQHFDFVNFPTKHFVTIRLTTNTYLPGDIPVTLEGLKKYRLIIKRDGPLGPLQAIIKENSGYNYHWVNTFKNGLQMLKVNRADYYIAYDRPIQLTVARNPQLQGVRSNTVFSMQGHLVVVCKNHPDSKQLTAILSKTFEDLFKEGIMNRETGLLNNYEFQDNPDDE